MLKKLLLFLPFFFYCSIAFSQPQQTFNGTTGVISDNQQWHQFPCNVSGLNQANLNGTWGFEKLTLSILHNNVSDLEVHLVSPNGTDVLIFKNVGGTGNNFTNTGFKMNYTTPIAAGTAPFSGNYLPQGDLGLFNNGQNGNGTWYLRIRDNQPSFQGILTSWSIRFGNGPAMPPFSSNLPLILINTNGQPIPDDPKIPADFVVIDNGPGQLNTKTDTTYAYQGKIGIEQRGSSSASAPKKSYGFETWDGNGVEIDTSFLGFPPQSDWILAANYFDKTLMRNVLSYKLFNDMQQYASRTKFCELFLNNQYMGVYVVMEKIKRDENRVNIAKLTNTDTTGDQLTGGYILKIDKFTGNGGGGFYSNYPPSNPTGDVIYYQYEYPSDVIINQPQQTYIRAYVDSFEQALFSNNFQSTQDGYRLFGDERSFMDLMFLNEMSKNVDGYRLSTYFHKDKRSKGGKLKAGPAWDYDITWMNANYCEAEIDTGWAYNLNYVCPGAAVPAHWERMMQDTLFRQHARCRWFALRQSVLHIDTLFAFIDSTAAFINEAQQRNFVKWPIMGVATWPEPQPLPQTYAEQIQRLKSWITHRFAWLDAQFGAMPVLNYKIDLGDDTTICSGNGVVMQLSGFDNYHWSNGSKQAAIQATLTGIYSVTVSDNFGCSGTDSRYIEVLPLPVIPIGNDTVICENQTVTINAGTHVAYLWNTGEKDSSITVSIAGLYAVTVTDINGCTASANMQVAVSPLPDASFTAQQNGVAGFIFSANDTTASCLWNFGDGTTSTDNSPQHTYNANGVYTVTLSVTNDQGCTSATSTNLPVTGTSIEKLSDRTLRIYPNPANDVLTLTLNNRQPAAITIKNASGTTVLFTHYKLSTDEMRINVSAFASGVYFVMVETAEGIFADRFVKQ